MSLSLIPASSFLGLDISYYGEPFNQVSNTAFGDNSSLDLCYFAEPFTLAYNTGGVVVPPILYNATQMFIMF